MIISAYCFNLKVDEHGRHEIHSMNCGWLPSPGNREILGIFDNCKDAINYARQQHPDLKFDGCFYCCPECHKG